MPDIINLLSDHIANQIAAGEVIQRPSSAVKELMENSIDAGSTEIQLIIKDAGKELIQVADNGKGMSTTDARMSFERHATSKIRTIDDLFTIRTMGFRGEALASIAAVAQVEMRTRQKDNENGTRIVVEGTEVKLQELCATSPGTNIMVKNLFYNVPARRNFLKSVNVEYRNILEEFTRIALANPAISFRLWNNGTEQYHLNSDNLKTRIVGLLGSSLEKKLAPVEEKTDLINFFGFIGKPETAARTRGNQYFFVNGRFIRSPFLNHAVVQAYESLIEKETFPFYVLFMEVDPSRVDVNVHPTKQEVKFEDERMMYAYLNAAIKHALAKFNISPALDFTINPEIAKLPSVQMPFTEKKRLETENGYLRNVFSGGNQAHFIERKDSLKQWKDLYQIAKNPISEENKTSRNDIKVERQIQSVLATDESDVNRIGKKNVLLLQNSILAASVKSGLMFIDICRAQERIWYEKLKYQLNNNAIVSQRLLFPPTYEFPPQDAILLSNTLEDLVKIGIDIALFGKNTFVVQGLPPELQIGDEKALLDNFIEQLKNEGNTESSNRNELLLSNLARRLSLKKDTIMQPEGQLSLIDELFATTQPEYTQNGKKIFTIVRIEEINNMLN